MEALKSTNLSRNQIYQLAEKFAKELGLSDLDKEDYSKYREKVFQKW